MYFSCIPCCLACFFLCSLLQECPSVTCSVMSNLHTSRFLLLYASQTGQAESISELIYDNAVSNGFSVERHCLTSTDDKVTDAFVFYHNFSLPFFQTVSILKLVLQNISRHSLIITMSLIN